ncbi:Protein CBG25637 [Caenorhabditis briggsae]|uniref:Protein CBG25637 n=1 Tax=Caenorhabditis briggsae TaxID=6238 RepID=B6IFC1_CAEBR|nr:Protein CBG25637 [Caenorhabditis briggsae]CAR98601.1 Protein CBG25637 [Caenorhabditis briggsae]
MSFVPSEVRLDHTYLEWDREWIFQRLPKVSAFQIGDKKKKNF